MNFIHTADWQLGKPFARVEDSRKQVILQEERMRVLERIRNVVRDRNAAFVLVAGDLFDSPRVTRHTVSAACSAIGQMEVPVIVIPGNHDHGGPGGIWEQEFFLREKENLAPNLRILLKPEPFEVDDALIYPCPLRRRAESADTTAWLRSPEVFAHGDGTKVRIILAHGSTRGFTTRPDDDDAVGHATNRIDLGQLPEPDYDYIALGDWHGTKQVDSKAWYSGTPELDRFPKGDENNPGNILVVEATREHMPQVEVVETARFRWSELSFDFTDDDSLARLEEKLAGQLGNRSNEDLLRLRLSGALGIDASNKLEKIIESLQSRLLRLDLVNETDIAATEAEIQSLTGRHADPLIASVAEKLLERASRPGEPAATAGVALRELHAAVARNV